MQTQVVAPAVTDDAEEDEESMDWWTKYFASIDTMIEVSCGMITKTRFNASLYLLPWNILVPLSMFLRQV